MTSEYDRFKLTFQLTAHREQLEVRVRTLSGQSKAEVTLPPPSLLDLLTVHDPAYIPSSVLKQTGRPLYQCLTAGDIDELVAEVFQDARQSKRPVHVELRFDPDQTRLAQYPWETITDDMDRLLVRDGLVDLTRYISYPQAPPLLDAALQSLPILQVVSQPAKLRPLAPVELALEKLERLTNATFEQLQHRLLIERLALWGLHFDGHGALVQQCRECDSIASLEASTCRRCGASLSNARQVGMLAFERNGDVEWISTEELGSVLYNARVRLALLLACETARLGSHLIFAGLAPGLILAGVPAVIGMQYPVSDGFARNFANAFYGRLLRSQDILDAMRTARTMTTREAWYSPVLYLRCRRALDTEGCDSPLYGARSIDTAVPVEAQEGAVFLVRLWIRRPETQPLTQEQLRKELGVLTPVPISTREVQGEVKFEPVEGRTLRRGEVEVTCTSPACDVYPDRIKLFVDEHLDAPAAIFTCRGRKVGRTALHFSIWQDGGEIAAVAHSLQVIAPHQMPRDVITSEAHTVPIEEAISTLDLATPGEVPSLLVQSGTEAGREIPLTQPVISIGRSFACDLALRDPSLSRRHAEIRRHDQGWTIADLGSTNGTFVNGLRLTAPRRLRPGDEIRLGNVLLSLVEHETTTGQFAPSAPVADAAAVPRAAVPARAGPPRVPSPRPAPRRRHSAPGRTALATIFTVLLAAGLGIVALSGRTTILPIYTLNRASATPTADFAVTSVAALAATPTPPEGLIPPPPAPTLEAATAIPSATEMAAPVSTSAPTSVVSPSPQVVVAAAQLAVIDLTIVTPTPSPVSGPTLLVAAGSLWAVVLILLVLLILLIRRRRRG